MRPLGAILLGGYSDRHGRRKGLLLTLSLMAFGTLSIACTPGYATHRHPRPVDCIGGPLVARSFGGRGTRRSLGVSL